MTRKYWPAVGPSLLVGIGIIVSTLVAVLTAESGWWVLAGPLLLAGTFVSADILDSRLKGVPSGPSWAAVLLGSTFLLAGSMVAWRDPDLVETLIVVIGPSAWITILLRSEGERKACKWTNINR